jgi:hypothetical protein
MMTRNKTHRECVDCYYRSGKRCPSANDSIGRGKGDADGACESFVRASLRFAFFHTIIDPASSDFEALDFFVMDSPRPSHP